ncbi:putative mediator of RNA polymerase II transcription subunit 26 [Eupeodes corollae]|uniref:putative mediator of RNA polymerase II transcription subunit 26 n=1 Tax=Eupeodes corollae TaxID=290404 RepID=UPI00249372FC|nr:putative mediator of RNA polymerase II transcription subunit 26 [Eupeodes corollae]XP_055923672.1 putative mediator of RNA polymerase II transcription subunit 26 [Eupeodes corollae]XP_055923673.1 putative mediator of RNA polymerase II transcription subunit 26 [Eupeodes corollae]XP_055923674.1 putative mediator of RNA polymerase II transcription subunit 26 [Eupeodes corollae]
MFSLPEKLISKALLLLFLTEFILSETINRTPARILAKQTGAAQFEEHIEQHRDCNEHHHRLRKRSSDEDLDYEVYQGVVGRPGIDFPIFPRIPQTTFSCRSYGNGYFADLETTCQVFHICEEGRKISFLCPNGTIFQQSELTCDWWFKVNCAGSPGFYAESSEILSKSRRHRVKVNSLHKGYTSNNKVAEIIPESRHYKGSDRRIDSNENPSVESFDFEDLSDDKSNNKSDEKSIDRSIDTSNDRSNYRTNNRPSDRSSVRSNDRSNNRSNSRPNTRTNNRSNNRSNEKLKIPKDELLTNPPLEDNHNQNNEQELQITAESSSFVKNPRINSYTSGDKTLNKESEFDAVRPSERVKEVQTSKVASPARGSQKHGYNDNDKIANFYITSKPDLNLASTPGKVSYYTTAFPEHYTNRNSLDGSSVDEKQFVTPESEDHPALEAHSTIRPDFFANGPIINRVTTPSQYHGTYSTARRLDTTRTTPFYTPTVPSIVRTRPTESKTIFVNVVKTDEPTTLRGAITTENITPKPLTTTEREENSDIHRFSIFSNKDLNVQLPIYSEGSSKPENSLGSSTSGPTYLPKFTKSKKENLVTPASINSFVSRNIEGIIQTVGVLKETMKNKAKEDKNSSTRVGLEIPPSSGPGTLISLTNYFANDDQLVSTTSSGEETTTIPTSTAVPSFNISAGLLSNKTSGKYFSLFGLGEDKSDAVDDYSVGASTDAPQIVNAPTVVGDFTRTTIRDLAQDPETRKIAQVFSNAISKYIENPETFRKDLIGVRPQPPSNNAIDSTTPSSNRVSTVSNNNISGTTASNSLNKNTSKTSITDKDDSTTSATTESNDIAKEINNEFDVSTPAYGAILPEFGETTTYRIGSFSTSSPQTNIETGISSELLPPNLDDENEHESLHKVQSQSFIKSYNDLAKSSKSNPFDAGGKNKSSFDSSVEKEQTEKQARTEDPWTHSAITQTDNATDKTPTTIVINQRESAETTESPWSQPKKSTTNFETSTQKSQGHNPWIKEKENTLKTTTGTALTTTDKALISKDKPIENTINLANPWLQNQLPTVKPTENPWSQITQSIYLDPLTINDGLMREPKTTTSRPVVDVNTDRSRFEDVSQGEEGIEDILNSPELSSELLPKNNGLQRIANKLFGGLNETEAVHLQNVMKKAEHNQNVLRLLLLLIQTCDDQNGKALEKSRKILLNALIGMDEKLKIKNISHVSATTTTNKIPVTTYHRVFSDKVTSTTTSATTTQLSNESEETTKFEIHVPDEEDNTISTSTLKPVSLDRQSKSYNNPNKTSDERALELLKSLYSLASKFSRR